MMRNRQFSLDPPGRLTEDKPMPALLSNFHLCFRVKYADSIATQEGSIF